MAEGNPQAAEKLDQFPLRFPPGMRAEIKDAAKRNGRTMNAEIIDRLERVPNMELAMQVIGEGNAERERLQAELNGERQSARQEAQHWGTLEQSYVTRMKEDAATIQKLEAEVEKLREDLEVEHRIGRQMQEMLSSMQDLLQTLVKTSDEDHHERREIDRIRTFLQWDVAALQFELSPDPDAPPGFDPIQQEALTGITHPLATTLIALIDARTLRVGRLSRRIDDPDMLRAKLLCHSLGLTDVERQIAKAYVEQDASRKDAGAFYDYGMSLVDAAPEDQRPELKRQMEGMMERLFTFWTPIEEDPKGGAL